jgi:hypothetical protein
LRNGYASGRQKDRNKRERGKADVNGSGGTIPWSDITVQTAEPTSLPEKEEKEKEKPTSVENPKQTEQIPFYKTHEIKH